MHDVPVARSSYAKDVEHTIVHQAGLLTSGYKRFPSRLPIHTQKMFFKVQDSGFSLRYLSFSEILEGMGRLPVTVARLCRNCTDFPILPVYRYRPPDEIGNVLLPASSIRRDRRQCQLIFNVSDVSLVMWSIWFVTFATFVTLVPNVTLVTMCLKECSEPI